MKIINRRDRSQESPDPHLPRANTFTFARGLQLGAYLTIVLAGAKLASAALLPIATAVFLSILSAPIITRLKHLGVPRFFAILSALIVNLGGLLSLGLVIFISIQRLTRELPRYRVKLREQTQTGVEWLRDQGLQIKNTDVIPILDLERSIDLATIALSNITSFLSNTLLVLIILAFILTEADLLVSKIRYLLSRLPRSVKIDEENPLTRAASEIQTYLVVKAATSLATGLLVAAWFGILGVEFAMLWGILAFMLNFIPNIGSFIAVTPALLVTLVMQGPGYMLAAATGSFTINVIIGNFVEPRIMGQALGISTTVVVLSVVFWGWMFGPVGAILSVPLTMIAKIAMSYSEDMRWLAMLLDDKLPPGAQRNATGSIAIDMAGPTEH
jgi:predicted PurR-regulated permease PerM